MLNYLNFYSDNSRCPYSRKELVKIVTQAKDNNLKVKYSGGTYPVSKESSEIGLVLVSLKSVKRLLTYDPLKKTITVEPGFTLKELTTSMEYLDYTLDLYGTLPNMTVADAINVGLIGSNGTISTCLKSCQVVCSNAVVSEWIWPTEDQIPGPKTRINQDIHLIPSLQSLVCGLGIVGIINKCTLNCVPMKYAQENISYTTVDDIIVKVNNLSESMFVNIHWFPLLDKVVVTNAGLVRLRNAQPQPTWKKYFEYFCWSVYWVIHRISPGISWYLTGHAQLFSQMQFVLMKSANTFHTEYSYRPQTFTSVASYCGGVKWVLPLASFEKTIRTLETWSRSFPYVCSTPLCISLQTHKDLNIHRPFLCPYSDKETFTIWSDWFRSSSISAAHSVTMAEYEAILQKNGGRKCWSAGPVYASPLIGQLYPGFRHFCETKDILDPRAMFRSSYVEGDIFGEQY